MKNILLVVSVAIISVLMVILIMDNKKIPKTAYVEVEKMYKDFDYKKELENKLTLVKRSRQGLLDSMKLELQLLLSEVEKENGKNQEKVDVFNAKREAYLQKGKEFEQDNQALTVQYDELILKQLKQYIKDYGTANGYTYIFGSLDNANLLYEEEAKNITVEVTEYVNKKYKGVNK